MRELLEQYDLPIVTQELESNNEIQSEKHLKPIADSIVKIIEERSSGVQDLAVFGSAENPYEIGYETVIPSFQKSLIENHDFRVLIGGPNCKKPYSASVYNVSALSFGPIGKKFILSVNQAAKEQGFYQNTGEAGISPYHFGDDIDIEASGFDIDEYFNRKHCEEYSAGDLVWEIGSGYYGCCTVQGKFDESLYRLKAALPSIKMIEIKLSQGLEPSKRLPVKRLTPGIAKVLGVSPSSIVALPTSHREFSNPVELLKFVERLRILSGCKPIGIKLSVGNKRQFMSLCKAMLVTKIVPDFLTIDGMEAGTSGSSRSVTGFMGSTLDESLVFANNILIGCGLRKHLKIIASGRVFSERDIVSKMARGADICATARSILIATGCDQQLECYKGTCNKGIATQDPKLLSNFDCEKATRRVRNFHEMTMQGLSEILSVMGLISTNGISMKHVQKRISVTETRMLSELYQNIPEGSLNSYINWRIPSSIRQDWKTAKHNQF
ncbi:MAG: glutamate synthase-related protein [Candidatus Melainabacteria bacterium]